MIEKEPLELEFDSRKFFVILVIFCKNRLLSARDIMIVPLFVVNICKHGFNVLNQSESHNLKNRKGGSGRLYIFINICRY